MGRIAPGRGLKLREIKQKHVAEARSAAAGETVPEQERLARVEGEVWRQGRIPQSFLTEELAEAIQNLNPKEVAFFCAWVMNGRDISAAARTVGWRPQYGQRLFQVHPGIRAAIDWVHNVVLPDEADWTLLLPEARRTMRSLLDARDEKVRFWAAKDMIDRAEGKPTARLDMVIRDERPSMSDGELQLLFSIMQATKISYAEAASWIRAHPEETQQWISQHVLPPGRAIKAPPVSNPASPPVSNPASPVPPEELAVAAVREVRGEVSSPALPSRPLPLLAYTHTPP